MKFARLGSVCLALLVTLPGWAQSRAKPADGGVVAKGLPNLNPATCRSDNAPVSGDKCSVVTFDVVVNPLTKGGKTIGCAAFFFYRDLTIQTKKMDGGETTTVQWEIKDFGTAAGAQARFIDPGIRILSKPGPSQPKPGDLFEPVTHDGALKASVKVKKQINKKSFDHLPVVQYKDDNFPWTDCGGVDPTIGNNPN